MVSELTTKVGDREERAGVIETLLILSVASLYLPVVPGRVRANELVLDVQLLSGGFKERLYLSLASRESVRELETIVRLHTLDSHALSLEEGVHFLEEFG